MLQSGSSFYVHARLWVSAVLPSSGPVSGGTRLAVAGSSFRESARLRCRLAESGATAAARVVSSMQLECASPASSGAGVRHVEVSMNGQQYSSSGVEYTYGVSAVVSLAWASRGAAEGGAPVTLLGAGFSSAAEALGELWCRFNSTASRAAHVSESAAVCNTTRSGAGVVSVEVSSNGRDFSGGGARYEFVSVSVRSLAPWSGPQQGGTVVTVGGSGLSSSAVEAVACRFGGSGGGALASAHGGVGVRCVTRAGLSTWWVGV